ncbi:unnamed protein product, partial [Mucor fragilis]
PNDVVHAALAFITDSFRLPLCLWYDPRSIAAAALLMGYHGHDIKFPADTSSAWGQYLEANSDLIGETAGSIMEVYKLPKKYSSNSSSSGSSSGNTSNHHSNSNKR